MIMRFIFVLIATIAGGGIYAGESTWTRLGGPSRAAAALAVDPHDSTALYAATEAGLFQSHDLGRHGVL